MSPILRVGCSHLICLAPFSISFCLKTLLLWPGSMFFTMNGWWLLETTATSSFRGSSVREGDSNGLPGNSSSLLPKSLWLLWDRKSFGDAWHGTCWKNSQIWKTQKGHHATEILTGWGPEFLMQFTHWTPPLSSRSKEFFEATHPQWRCWNTRSSLESLSLNSLVACNNSQHAHQSHLPTKRAVPPARLLLMKYITEDMLLVCQPKHRRK